MNITTDDMSVFSRIYEGQFHDTMSVPKREAGRVVPVEASVVGRELLSAFVDRHQVKVELDPGAIEELRRKPRPLIESENRSEDTPSK